MTEISFRRDFLFRLWLDLGDSTADGIAIVGFPDTPKVKFFEICFLVDCDVVAKYNVLIKSQSTPYTNFPVERHTFRDTFKLSVAYWFLIIAGGFEAFGGAIA